MMMKTTCIAALAGALVLAVVSPTQADTPSVLADWQMNEGAGAAVMEDSSGNAHHGDVGDEVTTGVSVGDATGYRFPRLKPNTPPAHPEHNVTVPHRDALNPNNRDYSVEIRYRTTNKFGNITQKGQAGTKGGYWKIQLPQGEPSCLFRGPTGVTNAVRARGIPLNDGAWHVVRCEATPTEVRLYVDGVFIGRNRGTTGSIANDQPLMVGGKNYCDQVTITCDYFGGDIDYLRIEAGDDGGGSDTGAPTVTSTSPEADAVGVRRGANVTATFSEPVTGVSATTMTLRRASNGAQVAAVVSYNSSSRTATLNPSVHLPKNTLFTVTLGSGIEDADDNQLAPSSWSFTTAG